MPRSWENLIFGGSFYFVNFHRNRTDPSRVMAKTFFQKIKKCSQKCTCGGYPPHHHPSLKMYRGGGVPFVQAHFSCIFVIFLKICFGHNSAGISRISMKINQIKATIKNQIFPAPGPHRTSKMKKNSQKKKNEKIQKCTKFWGGVGGTPHPLKGG